MELQNLPWYGQFLVFMVIGAILLGIFYFVYYSPTSDEIKTIVDESERLQDEIRKGEINESKLKRLEEEKIHNEVILEQLKGILPERREAAQILSKIQAIASNARLRFNLFNPGSERVQEIYMEWPILMKFEGNYNNLAVFFDQVSRLTKIFNINGLHIAPLAAMTPEYTISADFTATTYIYREGGTVKAAAKLAPKKPAQPAPKGEEKLGDF